jgi:predicted CopG family antitoxin
MASKMIAIKERLYEKLTRLKKQNQSFSDVIEELLLKSEKNPLKHFGIGKSIASQDLDDFEEILIENRRQNRSHPLKWRNE